MANSSNRFKSEFQNFIDSLITMPRDADLMDMVLPGEGSADGLAYVRDLFSEPARHLGDLEPEDVNRALLFLHNPTYSRFLMPLIDPAIDPKLKVSCANAISPLFEWVHARWVLAFDSTIYMWWDVFPTEGQPNEAAQAGLDEALLVVMKNQLELDLGPMCASAIHGLNHWHRNYPTEVVKILSDFELSASGLTPELRQQIGWAKMGSMQ